MLAGGAVVEGAAGVVWLVEVFGWCSFAQGSRVKFDAQLSWAFRAG